MSSIVGCGCLSRMIALFGCLASVQIRTEPSSFGTALIVEHHLVGPVAGSIRSSLLFALVFSQRLLLYMCVWYGILLCGSYTGTNESFIFIDNLHFLACFQRDLGTHQLLFPFLELVLCLVFFRFLVG